MLVQAKCIMPAFDSVTTKSYKPGEGPLPEGLYEIDRDGPLALLKTAGGPKGKYVFEFDRNANPADKPHDYSCKKDGCGAFFKSLAALGSHTRSAHKDDPHPLAEAGGEKPEDGDDTSDEGGVSDRTCDICGKVARNVYGLRLHIEKSHPPQVVTESVAETAVPA